MVTAGPKGKVTAAPGSVEAVEGQQGSCRRVHRRVHHRTGGTGSETAEAAAVATRDDQWAVRRPTDCATKISNSLLTRPSRRRQRLPVQLWGQLQRPCRVLGAATDSWKSTTSVLVGDDTMWSCSLGRRSRRDRLDSPVGRGSGPCVGGLNTGSGPLLLD